MKASQLKKWDGKSKAGKLDGSLTREFREMVESCIGKLDTATSFMYLYRRFGVPTYDNKDEYKILYDYRFCYEDITITVHASYHEFVYFSLHVPQKRVDVWRNNRTKFFQQLYKKHQNIPFMPFSQLPWGGSWGLNKAQQKKNWKLINTEAEKYFSEADDKFIEKALSTKDSPDQGKAFDMLRPFEKELCNRFRAALSQADINEIENFRPSIADIPGLTDQCEAIINEFKEGVYVRDVRINILGYESETNPIPLEEEIPA